MAPKEARGSSKTDSKASTRREKSRETTPKFTTDWFSGRIEVWQRLLAPELAGKPCRALELGSYEGRSALWTLENLLENPRSHLTCVDSFTGVHPQSARLGRKTPADIRSALLSNLRPYFKAGKASLLQEDVAVALRTLAGGKPKPMFDFVYVDADGSGRDYLEQAVLVWPLLKARGFLVFDDYTHSKEHDQSCPRPGIDAFMNLYAREIKVVHSGWQLILRKRTHKLPLGGCRSEYYHEDMSKI